MIVSVVGQVAWSCVLGRYITMLILYYPEYHNFMQLFSQLHFSIKTRTLIISFDYPYRQHSPPPPPHTHTHSPPLITYTCDGRTLTVCKLTSIRVAKLCPSTQGVQSTSPTPHGTTVATAVTIRNGQTLSTVGAKVSTVV